MGVIVALDPPAGRELALAASSSRFMSPRPIPHALDPAVSIPRSSAGKEYWPTKYRQQGKPET